MDQELQPVSFTSKSYALSITMSEILATIMDAVFNGTLIEDAGMEIAYDRFLY